MTTHTPTLTTLPGSLLKAGDTLHDLQPDGTYRAWRQIITNLSIHGDCRAMLDNGNIQPFLNAKYTVTRDPAFVEDAHNVFILNELNRATMDNSRLLAGMHSRLNNMDVDAVERRLAALDDKWREIANARKHAGALAVAELIEEG